MGTTTGAASGVTLNDLALFRQACYVNGAWVQARSGATIDVDNPAKIFGVGKVVEKFSEQTTRKTYDDVAAFMNQWIKDKGL